MSASPDAGKKKKLNQFRDLNALVDSGTIQKLKGSDLAVWLVMFRFADRKSRTVRIGRGQLTASTGLSKRAVDYSIANLVDAKLIRVLHRGGPDAGASTYRIRGHNPDG